MFIFNFAVSKMLGKHRIYIVYVSWHHFDYVIIVGVLNWVDQILIFYDLNVVSDQEFKYCEQDVSIVHGSEASE